MDSNPDRQLEYATYTLQSFEILSNELSYEMSRAILSGSAQE